MQIQNIRFLERLSIFASLAGVVNVFLGLVVIFVDVTNQDWRHIQIGIYVFITGYAFAKVSQKVGDIALEERNIIISEALRAEREKAKKEQKAKQALGLQNRGQATEPKESRQDQKIPPEENNP